MSPDSSSPPSIVPTRAGTPAPQRDAGEYLAAPLRRENRSSEGYLAGCKALDSLAHLIASTESFFHPSNSGSWTTDVSELGTDLYFPSVLYFDSIILIIICAQRKYSSRRGQVLSMSDDCNLV